MLLTAERVQHATTLDHVKADACLVRAGYTDNKLMAVRFFGINEHFQFVYETMYSDDSKEFGFSMGKVFFRYFEQPEGIMLLGEY